MCICTLASPKRGSDCPTVYLEYQITTCPYYISCGGADGVPVMQSLLPEPLTALNAIESLDTEVAICTLLFCSCRFKSSAWTSFNSCWNSGLSSPNFVTPPAAERKTISWLEFGFGTLDILMPEFFSRARIFEHCSSKPLLSNPFNLSRASENTLIWAPAPAAFTVKCSQITPNNHDGGVCISS